MQEVIKITEQFKQELQNLLGTFVDTITVYRKEGDKIFFQAGSGKFHLTQEELEAVIIK